MIVLAFVATVIVLLVITVPALAMTQNGEYDNVSFGCLGFWGGLAVATILGLGVAFVI